MRRIPIAVCLASILWTPIPGGAQTNERIYEDLDFRFVTPGARAAGMGKTFIGLADDATAAVSNPAGLSNLLEQEFSFEFTRTRLKHQRYFPTEAGPLQTFGDVVLTPSFFSYVVPVKRATIAVFRNSMQNYREEFEVGDRFIPAINGTEDGTLGKVSVQVESYGIGSAFVLTPQISVGGSVTLLSLDIAGQARSGTPLNPRNGTDTIDSDLGWSALVGTVVKPVPSLSIGATFNKGAVFDVETTLFGSFLFTIPTTPPRRIDVVRTGEEHPVNYVLPDRYSAGFSWRAADSFTVLADVTRVLYSQQITDKFLVVDFQDPDARVSADNFSIQDVSELHAGAEWRVYSPRATVAVRGGAFTSPDHRLRFTSGGNNLSHPADPLLNFRFSGERSKTDVGVTVGGGITFATVQIDGAASFSPDASDVIVSMVVRLP